MLQKMSMVSVLTLVITSCAKDRPYEEVWKSTLTIPKDQFVSLTDEYLYMPSQLNSPMSNENVNSFWQGDEKLVRFQFTEKSLDAYKVNDDQRFDENVANLSPVISIPVEYKAYRCKENENKECSRQEEENLELEWNQKNYIIPRFDAMTVQEINTLEIFNFSSSCTQELDKRLVSYEWTDDTLNIEIEKVMKYNVNDFLCILPLFFSDDLSSGSYRIRELHSFVKLKSLASEDYQSVHYPITDHDEFGFFQTEKKTLNHVYDHSRKEINNLLHRWNPNRSSIEFYLDESFYKPENKVFLDGTNLGISRINMALESIGVKFRVKIMGRAKARSGDLRYNMINLIEDPLESGLLGYAPVAVNPKTGEIVHGHVNMYGGVLRQYVYMVYNSMVDLDVSKNQISDLSLMSSNEAMDSIKNIDQLKLIGKNQSERIKIAAKMTESHHQHQDNFHYHEHEIALLGAKDLNKRFENLQKERVKKRSLAFEKQLADKENEEFESERMIRKMANSKVCSSELISIAQTAKKVFPEIEKIEGIKGEDGRLRSWDTLNAQLQLRVSDAILPRMYVQTFVHEFGHILGLRHNFKGSYDAKNFYTPQEAQSLGLHTAPAYSSIMDYAQSDLNSLGTFGKYDLAALRFGYKREVENNKGNFINVTGSLSKMSSEIGVKGLELKTYEFCTDENAGLNTGCSRHDEGTTRKEIAMSYVQDYELGYKYRNFRNGRNVFKSTSLSNYISGLNWKFGRARLLFEDYEMLIDFFNGIFGSPFGELIMDIGCHEKTPEAFKKVCDSNADFINDAKDAVEIVGNMFLKILNTPDLTCYLELPDGKKIYETMEELFKQRYGLGWETTVVPKTCFDQKFVEVMSGIDIKVLGEAGKYFHSLQDPDGRFKYVDDIGNIGIWPDKLLALKFLTNRYLSNGGNIERIQANMITVPFIQKEVLNYFQHVLLGEALLRPTVFYDQEGKSVEVDNFVLSKDHHIPEQSDMRVIKAFGLPQTSSIDFVKAAIKTVKRYNKTHSLDYKEESRLFDNLLSVDAIRSTQAFSSEIDQTVINGIRYGANNENVLAQNLIDSIESEKFLKQLDPEIIKHVLNIKMGQYLVPESFSQIQKDALSILELASLVQIGELKKNGVELDRDFLVQSNGEEQGNVIWKFYSLPLDEIVIVIDFVKNITKVPAGNTDENINKLYQTKATLLDDFVNGALGKKNDIYKKSLEMMAD